MPLSAPMSLSRLVFSQRLGGRCGTCSNGKLGRPCRSSRRASKQRAFRSVQAVAVTDLPAKVGQNFPLVALRILPAGSPLCIFELVLCSLPWFCTNSRLLSLAGAVILRPGVCPV